VNVSLTTVKCESAGGRTEHSRFPKVCRLVGSTSAHTHPFVYGSTAELKLCGDLAELLAFG